MKIDDHKKQFGTQAENYTKYRKPYIEELYKFLFSLIPEDSKKILDVACGTGKSTAPLVMRNFEVFGCDHDPLMIEEAKKQAVQKNLNINYCVADVEHLPFHDEAFDVVTIGTAFHWFVNEKSITEIKRVLKPGGLIFIFWTLSKDDSSFQDEIPGTIFHSYGWERVPPELRDLNYISKFLEDNNLVQVKTIRLPFSYNATVEEQVGLQKTASSYGLLSEEDKARFLDEVTSALTAKLGDRECLTFEEEIHICYGFKS